MMVEEMQEEYMNLLLVDLGKAYYVYRFFKHYQSNCISIYFRNKDFNVQAWNALGPEKLQMY